MARKTLTDRTIKALKPLFPKGHKKAGQRLAAGERLTVMDADAPGLGIRVTDKGHKTFILAGRFPGSRFYTRRELGEYGAVSLEDARQKARDWRQMARQGVDPAAAEETERRKKERQRANSFGSVAEAWFLDKLPGERKGKEVEQDVRREFVAVWGERPITEITKSDVRTLIKEKAAVAPAQARNLLGYAKRLFDWAVEEDAYGIERSPCESIKPKNVVGEKTSGERILSDDELFALWRTARRLPYPYGPVYQLLILTALRLNEAADGSWPEFDLRARVWTIPAIRMKGKNSGKGKAREHVVPLIDDMLAVLEGLPRFKKGDYLFSTTFGEKSVWMSAKVKSRVDDRMLRTLRAMARRRGDDSSKVALPHWTNHDVRRTVRSNLSRLKIAEEVREAVLAHARPGIKGVYDKYDYLKEKREALELWAARLRSIVEPPPANVVQLAARI